MLPPPDRYRILGAIVLLTVLVWLIYMPGLKGGFLFDDVISILENPKLLINDLGWKPLRRVALSSEAGPLKRPVSMLSFGINHVTTGLDPFYFKLTNWFIHWLNGVGFFLLTRLLLGAYRIRYRLSLSAAEINWLSLAVSGAWLVHPFNLTSVLYIVQRMTSLASLFTICGLIVYLWGRLRQLEGKPGFLYMLPGLALCAALAALSKESGLLLPFLIFVTEWIILGFQAPTRSGRRGIVLFNLLIAALPALLIIGFLALRFEWLENGYANRGFDLTERLLTQARVIWFYIQMILLPDTNQMGLYHDDIALSTGLLQPPTTLSAVVGILALLAGAVTLRHRAPLLAFGLLFFFVGHAMESTVFPLELAHEHRNYLPSYGLLLSAFYYLGHAAIRRRLSVRFQAAITVLLIGLLSAATAVRAGYWADDTELAVVEVWHHPVSVRSHMQAGVIYYGLAQQGIRPDASSAQARYHFEVARQLDPDNAAAGITLLILNEFQDRPLDLKLVEELISKLTTKPLSAASINAMIRLSRYQHRELCKLPPDVFNRLFQAILENPTLQGKSRSQVLTELAQFAISIRDIEMALYLTQTALTINPVDPQLYLNHALVLLHTGDYATARQTLARTRELDTDHFYAERIEQQERLLEQSHTADH